MHPTHCRRYRVYAVELATVYPTRTRPGVFLCEATIDTARQLRIACGDVTFIAAARGDDFTDDAPGAPVADVFRLSPKKDGSTLDVAATTVMRGCGQKTWMIRFSTDGAFCLFIVGDDPPARTIVRTLPTKTPPQVRTISSW